LALSPPAYIRQEIYSNHNVFRVLRPKKTC